MSQDGPSISSFTELHDNTFTSKDDRRIRGKTLASSYPHSDHFRWSLGSDREDLIEFLKSTNKGRLEELIPIRFHRMMASPFTFFRGAAAVMAADLSTTPKIGVKVQACGDCHLLNFGAFATPERHIVFDINDFDETLPAPWEWDLKRLATSFMLCARDNEIKDKQACLAVQPDCDAYRQKMAEYAKESILDIWYKAIEWEPFIQSTKDENLQRKLTAGLNKARIRDDSYYFPKLTEEVDGRHLIKDREPLIYHPSSADGKPLLEQVADALTRYKETLQDDRQRLVDRYKLADAAIKVVGVGSVGTMCIVALLLARDAEPLFLQFKEARQSVLEPYTGKSTYENSGQRVAAGQRIMQSASDIFLGWTDFEGDKHFYVRHLRDMKVKLEPETWDGKQLIAFAELTGSVLARAHARSGDAAVISAYLENGESFDEAITEFARSYAHQTELDHRVLCQAIDRNEIPVRPA